jgi:predicted dehydrogenase
MSDRYVLGIVGAGAIGAVHIETARTLSNVRLAAVCDAREGSAVAAATRTGAHAYTSHRQLVYEERLDGVILCTPPNTHHELARFFLDHGVDVLCEKPLAIEATQAREMYACAAENGRLLMLASKFRYVEGVATARQLLREERLGKIRHAEIVFSSNVDMSSRWNSDPEKSGGGVVIDNGSHAADICRYLFGPVTSVAAVAYSRTPGLQVEDSAYLYLGTENGAGATVDISWSLDRKLPYYIRIYGERGRLCVGWKETTLNCGPSVAPTPVAPGYSKRDAFLAVQRDFVAAAREGARARIDDADGLASVEVVDAAYEAIRQGGRREVA